MLVAPLECCYIYHIVLYIYYIVVFLLFYCYDEENYVQVELYLILFRVSMLCLYDWPGG